MYGNTHKKVNDQGYEDYEEVANNEYENDLYEDVEYEYDEFDNDEYDDRYCKKYNKMQTYQNEHHFLTSEKLSHKCYCKILRTYKPT